MPTVGDLLGLRRALPGATCICASPVAGDDLDAGMVLEPGGECTHLAIGQQIHDVVRLQVDEYSLVSLPAPPGPIIHPENTWNLELRDSFRSHDAQNGVGAYLHAEARDQPCAGLSSQCHPDAAMELGEAPRAPAISPYDLIVSLRECTPSASVIAATQASNIERYRHGAPLPRQIGKLSFIALWKR